MKFPMHFPVTASSGPGVSSLWSAQSDALSPLLCAIPTEFNGPGGGYSPEDLFGLAVLNCTIAIYKVYAEMGKITFREVRGKAIVTADKQPSERSFTLTHVELFLDIVAPSDPQKARSLMEQAIKDCAVGNSIKSGKSFHVTVSDH
jgi:uncharacterized OsmC-like protein